MKQSPGYEDLDNPHAVCLLKKCIYGLRQASKAWSDCLDGFLMKNSLVGINED